MHTLRSTDTRWSGFAVGRERPKSKRSVQFSVGLPQPVYAVRKWYERPNKQLIHYITLCGHPRSQGLFPTPPPPPPPPSRWGWVGEKALGTRKFATVSTVCWRQDLLVLQQLVLVCRRCLDVNESNVRTWVNGEMFRSLVQRCSLARLFGEIVRVKVKVSRSLFMLLAC